MVKPSISPMQGWIPYKLKIADSGIQCHWLNTRNKPYVEPFFDETILKIKTLSAANASYNSVSDLTMLQNWATLPSVEPAAFIFHISRCGSTLIAQLLSADEQNIVLAEVPFFDNVLRLPYQLQQVGLNYSNQLLRAALNFYGQKRTGNEKYLFVKTDSWHMFFYKQLRALYPHTPFILLYRPPTEVFNSHTIKKGIHVVQGLIEPEILGMGNTYQEPDVYLASVLEAYFTMYLKIADEDKLTLLLNYNQGIMPMMDEIAKFTNTPFSDEHYAKMNARINYHSKYPAKVFNIEDTPELNPVLQKAHTLYEQTEQKRLSML